MSTILRSEVLQALDRAEARGGKKVRVIVGLHPQSTMPALKDALQELGVGEVKRESGRFLALELTRVQMLRLSKLTEHVSSIRLDQPVRAAKH